jgi:superfamily II DNA or RNA helicase
MTVVESRQAVAVPEQGNLVRVRDRYWVVESVRRSTRPPDPLSSDGLTQHHLVRLVPIDDKGSSAPLSVFWEAEPGTEIRPQAELPDPRAGVDDADTFAAFLDAARWGAIASADPGAFQSPFRAGIDIEDYQLLPLVEALRMPRVALLIADDVGLGKTVESGLIAQELVLRNQAQRILVVCPPSLCRKWQREMREQFGLGFEVVDTEYAHRLRRERGVGVNPFRSHPRLIVSMEWIKFESQMRWFDEFLPPDPNTYPRAFDLLIVDEAHRIAPSAVGRYAKESMRTKAMRRLAPHFEHRLFLTATPHNGYPESFQALLEMLDPNRFTKGIQPSDRERDAVMVRRLKSHLRTMLPDGERNDERVIVFTEYRATLNYLDEMLTAPHPDRPATDGRVEVFHGSLDADERERIIREFNYNPRKTKVRVLLATDAASEGIDLHRACHRLVHVEVPFNPNRMEQRNGRVDRHGQKSGTVDIFHFASASDDEDDALGYDHSFLLRLAEKVDDIRDDLGSVSSVLAEQIEARMLREADRGLDIDAEIAARRDQARVDLETLKQRFGADIARVRDQYRASAEELDLTPESVQRAVEVALRIEGQPALRESALERAGGSVPVFEVDDLSGTWGETLVGLHNHVEDFRLPVTFDPAVAHGHQDVAYLHVGHPLVARCLRTLRAQVWGAAVDRRINRATVRFADVAEPVAVAHARVVVNGSDGSTLDEVIEPAAVRVGGRQGRLNVGDTRAAVASATVAAPAGHVRDRYVDQWQRVRPALQEALRIRAEEIRRQRGRAMDAKRDAEERRLRGTLADLQSSIRRRLDELERSEDVEQLRLFDTDERRQFDADVRALRDRVQRIGDDIDTEVGILRRRYAVRDVNWFPVAVEFLIPMGAG